MIYFGWSFQRYFAPERQLCPQSKERRYLPERRCKANQRHLKGASTSLKDNLFVRTPPILVAPMQITDVNSLDECPVHSYIPTFCLQTEKFNVLVLSTAQLRERFDSSTARICIFVSSSQRVGGGRAK